MTALFTVFATNPTGSDCLMSNGPILCAKGAPSLVVIIPCDDVCLDAQQCTHKVVMFDDVRAVYVACFMQADVDVLQQTITANQISCQNLDNMPATLAAVITCPPPTKGSAAMGSAAMIKALAASIEDRLGHVTDWAKQTLDFQPIMNVGKGPIASAEPNARLRTEDGESGSITGVHKKLA